MGDENRGQELPQRARGAARGGSAQPTAPVLSEEVRQRLRVAVEAERAEAANQERKRSAEPQWRPASSRSADIGTAGPPVNGIAGEPKHAPGPGLSVWPERAAEAERVIKPKHGAKPEHAAKPERPARSERPARTERAVKPESSGEVPASHQAAIVALPRTDRRPGPEVGEPRNPRGWHFVVATVLALAVIAAAGLVTTHFSRLTGTGKRGAAAVPLQETVVRTQAASWVAHQVSLADVVSCDPVMCAALSKDGFPSGKLLPLGQTSAPPVTSAVVVETPAVRNLFGSSLGAAWAPSVLATFGSGSAEIAVRVMAPHGTGAYDAALSQDLTVRRGSGPALLEGVKQIILSAIAQKQLNAGQVDSRVLLALASMAKDQPIDILRFGNIGSGASGDVLFRFADIATSDPDTQMTGSVYTQALSGAVSAVNALYQPTSSGTATSGGQTVFRIAFTAPSPLGGFQYKETG
jgi:hypothetical protein